MYKRLLKYLRPYKAQFIFAMFCMLLFGASDGGIPFIVKHVLDKVFQTQNQDLLYVVAVSLVVFAIFRAVFDFGQQFLMARIGHFIVRDIRNEINAHLLTLPPSYFIRQSSAQILSRITSDVALIRTLLTDSLASIIRDVVRVVTLLGAALYLDPVLAFIAAIVFPIGVLPVYRIGRRLRRLSRKGQEVTGTLSAMLNESILGNRIVKVFGQEEYETKRFEAENDRLTKTFVKSEVARALTGPINEILASVTVVGVILYGGFSVMHGARTQGDFIAFLIAVFLLYDPFKKLSRLHATIQQGFAGADRIFEVLDTKNDIADPISPKRLEQRNEIIFDHVTFAYNNESPVLADINLTIQEGKKTAIVGFSGAGKSTLIDLIPRFIDPQRGSIRIGGVSVRDVSLKELRSRIALVGQHTFLFNDTIYNNILYGNPSASSDEVYDAAKAAYAFDFVQQLPSGFNSFVGEAGLSLSGGERQRIAIARAILKNAPILILDEATASLDNRSEREVQSALEQLMVGRTTIVIAHRLSTVQDADMIVVLRDGEIVETGRHDTLLSSGGEYSRLYTIQFRDSDAVENEDDLLVQ